ncbi:hypothetical protein ABPG74_009559 [Tetrahymena malaccensis]
MSGLIYALYAGQFILNASNSSIAPFFPQKAKTFGIDETMIGLIFSVHPVGNFICSLIIGKQLSKGENRKPATLLGILLTGIGILGFAVVQYINRKWVFITVTLLARIILGVGQSLFSTPAYAYIPLLYKSTFEEKCGWMESVCGFGLMVGPLLGSVLIQLWGYVTPFIFFAGVSILLIPILHHYIPARIDFSQEGNELKVSLSSQDQELDEQAQDDPEEFEINYLEIFKDKDIILNYIAIFLPSCGLLFLDPTMGIYFEETYGLDDLYVGLVFSVGTVVYLLASPIGTKMLQYTKNYEFLLFLGSILTGISFFFLGPDEYTFLPQKLYITCIANGFIGLASILIYIPALPQLYKILLRMYPEENEEIIGDISSALYNTSYAVGEFIGPLLGGLLAQSFSFSRGASLFGLAIVGFSLIYMVFGGVFWKKRKIEGLVMSKMEEFPIGLSPAMKKVNSNKIRTRQPNIPGLVSMSSPMSNSLRPKFYTPTLKSDKLENRVHFVFQKSVLKKKKKVRKFGINNTNSSQNRTSQNMISEKQSSEFSDAVNKIVDEQYKQIEDFQFCAYSDMDGSDGKEAKKADAEHRSLHLFRKTNSQQSKSLKSQSQDSITQESPV